MQVLLEPFNYYSRMPGKGIRPKLIEAFNIWFQLPPEILSKIADITQKLHNASLVTMPKTLANQGMFLPISTFVASTSMRSASRCPHDALS
eukprot:1295864-Rhodomonas_salina.1